MISPELINQAGNLTSLICYCRDCAKQVELMAFWCKHIESQWSGFTRNTYLVTEATAGTDQL